MHILLGKWYLDIVSGHFCVTCYEVSQVQPLGNGKSYTPDRGCGVGRRAWRHSSLTSAVTDFRLSYTVSQCMVVTNHLVINQCIGIWAPSIYSWQLGIISTFTLCSQCCQTTGTLDFVITKYYASIQPTIHDVPPSIFCILKRRLIEVL